MEKTANQQNTAAEKPEEKAGMQKDTVENPSEVRTDSAFDEESEGSRATDKQENPDKTSAGAGAGSAAAADENDKDNDNAAAADADASPQCQTDLNELICEDMKKDIKKYREIRDLASRVFSKDGCVFRSEYTLKRFCQSVIWYTKSAKSMKRAFFVLSAFTIALPTIATLLNSVPDNFISNYESWIKLTVSVISAATAILTAFLNLFKFQHKWVQFRSTSEELQTELTVYLAQAGDYSEKSLTKPYVTKDKPAPEFSREKLDEMRENMFLINIEKIMAKEKSQWENLHKPSK
ncbi:MAG: DUF4231 domain-containing protein [Ruminococcus sp.]|nr:DUF4231 domain-containing protein [Ruminococcus sp.]